MRYPEFIVIGNRLIPLTASALATALGGCVAYPGYPSSGYGYSGSGGHPSAYSYNYPSGYSYSGSGGYRAAYSYNYPRGYYAGYPTYGYQPYYSPGYGFYEMRSSNGTN